MTEEEKNKMVEHFLRSTLNGEVREECLEKCSPKLYGRFLMACKDFKKKLEKKAKKKPTPEILDSIDELLGAYIGRSFDIAHSYYAVGYQKGFLGAWDIKNPE